MEDQIGSGDNRTFGADVAPAGPVQDMWQFDPLAGQLDADRTNPPATYTAGTGGAGLGGTAEPPPPGGDRHERRGF